MKDANDDTSSFNFNTTKRVLKLYKSELEHTDQTTSKLESKANTQMEITGVILGLYGIMSTIFLISLENLSASIYSIAVCSYIITMIITVVLLFSSLIFSIFIMRTKQWVRPVFYQTFSEEKEQETSKTIEKALKQCAKDEAALLIDLLKKVAFSLTVSSDNNKEMAKYIKRGFYFIIFGLISFISSITVLIIVAINVV